MRLAQPNIPDEQRELFSTLLSDSVPLEYEVIGQDAVADVLAGRNITTFDGGRHLTFADAIAIVSCAASIIQVVLALRPSRPDVVVVAIDAVAERISDLLESLVPENPTVKELLQAEPEFARKLARSMISHGLEPGRRPPA